MKEAFLSRRFPTITHLLALLAIIGMLFSVATNPMPATSAPLADTVVSVDTYVRGNRAFWGTASDGQEWGADANAKGNFSIVANRGVIANSSSPLSATLGPTLTDAEVEFRGSISSFTYTNLGAVVRFVDGNNWYKAHLTSTGLAIQKRVGGVITTLKTAAFTAVPNVEYAVRFRVVGQTLSARAWAVGASEPTTWAVVVNDSSLVSGQAGLRVQLQSGVTARFSSFIARRP